MDMEKVKSYSLVEISLLAIFMLGLLMAHWIVRVRSRIDLSDPIDLPGSGLSVSLPVGHGWNKTPAWQYDGTEDSMILIAQFSNPARRSRLEVRWRFVFSASAGTEQELLKQRAQKIGAVIQVFNTAGQNCPMIYAKLLLPSSLREEIWLGIIRLGHNRSLELLIRAEGVSGFLADDLLMAMYDSIQYRPTRELSDGSALMDDFLQLQAALSQPLPEEVFLIEDAETNKPLGYYRTRNLTFANQRQAYRTQIQQFEFNFLKVESQLWFNPAEKDYRWKTVLRHPRTTGELIYEITPNSARQLTVSQNTKVTKTFPQGAFFLPEPLLPALATVFLQGEPDSVVIDALSADGRVLTVRLSKIPPDRAAAKSEALTAVVRRDYLYHRNTYEELFFDASENILGKFEQQPNRRPKIWKATSIKVLQQLFQDSFPGFDDENITASTG